MVEETLFNISPVPVADRLYGSLWRVVAKWIVCAEELSTGIFSACPTNPVSRLRS